MKGCKKYFDANHLPLPQHYWTASKRKESDSLEESHGKFLNENEIIESVLNASEDVIYQDNLMTSNDDNFRGNKTDQACCEIDNWFDG